VDDPILAPLVLPTANPDDRPSTHRPTFAAGLEQLRAACRLIYSGATGVTAVSITIRLDPDSAQRLACVARRMAEEYGLQLEVTENNSSFTVRLSRTADA
jgi:hypothetical protein